MEIKHIEPWIDEGEVEEILEVVKSTFITENSKTEEFLEGIRNLIDAKNVIAMSNGTMALFACLKTLNLKPSDEVLVPDMTFIATSNAVLLAGGKPVVCDIDLSTGCISTDSIRQNINSNTVAIIPVHLYGQASDMDEIGKIAKEHSLCVIEDAAEAIGMKYNDKSLGTIGDFGIFSFFGNKVMTTAEGGVVVSKSEEGLKDLYKLKNHGRDRKGIFIHESIGYNLCFSDLNAAIGVAQLKKFSKIIKRKNIIFDLFCNGISSKEVSLITPAENVESNHWFYNVRVKDAERFSKYLSHNNIGNRRVFYPLHKQPCYEGHGLSVCENSVIFYNTVVSIPSSVTLTDDEIDYIVKVINEYK